MKSPWCHPIMPAVLPPLKPSLETSKRQLIYNEKLQDVEMNVISVCDSESASPPWHLESGTIQESVMRLLTYQDCALHFCGLPVRSSGTVKQWTRKTWCVHLLIQKWRVYLVYTSQSQFIAEGNQGRNSWQELKQRPWGMLHTGLLFIVGWAVWHQSLTSVLSGKGECLQVVLYKFLPTWGLWVLHRLEVRASKMFQYPMKAIIRERTGRLPLKYILWSLKIEKYLEVSPVSSKYSMACASIQVSFWSLEKMELEWCSTRGYRCVELKWVPKTGGYRGVEQLETWEGREIPPQKSSFTLGHHEETDGDMCKK